MRVILPKKCMVCNAPIESGRPVCLKCRKPCELVCADKEKPVSGLMIAVDMKSACCGADVDTQVRATCSEACHEEFVVVCEFAFGKYKKVIDTSTGRAHKVPTRYIVEFGLHGSELSKFPLWPEGS